MDSGECRAIGPGNRQCPNAALTGKQYCFYHERVAGNTTPYNFEKFWKHLETFRVNRMQQYQKVQRKMHDMKEQIERDRETIQRQQNRAQPVAGTEESQIVADVKRSCPTIDLNCVTPYLMDNLRFRNASVETQRGALFSLFGVESGELAHKYFAKELLRKELLEHGDDTDLRNNKYILYYGKDDPDLLDVIQHYDDDLDV